MIGIIKVFSFALLFHVLIPSVALAQSTSQKTLGFVFGYGDQRQLGVNYYHHVVFYKLHYGRNVISKNALILDMVIQPQYNVTEFRRVNSEPEKTDAFEFGVNVGLQLKLKLIPDFFNCYVMISTGPHYVSGVPKRQNEGFLFSDNIISGVNINLTQNTILDLNYGIRHISNAGLRSSNGGINNIIGGIGVLFKLNK